MSWYHSRFFRYALGTIMVLLIVFLFYQTQFAYKPFLDFISALFFPVLLAGILYYVLRPAVRFLEKRVHIPRPIAILLMYLVVFIILGSLSSYVGPILVEQIGVLTSAHSPNMELVKEKTEDIIHFFNINIISISELRDLAKTYLYKINEIISENIVTSIATVTKFAVWLFITPFILYYFLKDDKSIYKILQQLAPEKYQKEVQETIKDIDSALSMFITGQLLVAFTLGLLLLFGYLLIGLQNAFILAIFAMFCFTIPIFGSFIALIPALLVGLTVSPWMGLQVVLVMLVAQMIESNIISPQIMAQRLKIHPLALMLILLASGSLYGVLGLFLATPVYAIVRVIATRGLALYRENVT